jgi:phosphoglycerate dehydrogenase-like enzyme
MLRRIGDADAVLVSYTSQVGGAVLRRCPSLRYIGMCCSLYAPESANVDIRTADELGITVTGVRDYGDEGVVEYAVSELVRLLHGFGGKRWKDASLELTGQQVGILGLGKVGGMVADGLRFFGAEISYYSRTEKPEASQKGYTYRPLEQLLAHCDILITCLTKNVVLLHEAQFARMGDGKILMNTSIGPSYDLPALRAWLSRPGNYYLCDTAMALGDESLTQLPNVLTPLQSAGTSAQAVVRLSRKVLENIERFQTGSR